jgi:hypothetical protein
MGQPLTSADTSAKSIPNLSDFDPFLTAAIANDHIS